MADRNEEQLLSANLLDENLDVIEEKPIQLL